MMASVQEVEVVVAHSEPVTLRVGDVFLEIDSDQRHTDVETQAMAPVPAPADPVAQAAGARARRLPGTALGHLGEPYAASPAAWAAAGAALRTLHDAPLPPWPGPQPRRARIAPGQRM